jgi:hypothetical protein
MLDHKQSIKEVVRHALFTLKIEGLWDFVRRMRGRDTGHLRKDDLSEVFSDIYAKEIWVEDPDQATLSGVGSTDAATRDMAERLSSFLDEIRCRKLIDIGCGDFSWMRQVAKDMGYVGIDVVPFLIAENNAKYGNERHRFICIDATSEPIPTGDVAICREVLFTFRLRMLSVSFSTSPNLGLIA